MLSDGSLGLAGIPRLHFLLNATVRPQLSVVLLSVHMSEDIEGKAEQTSIRLDFTTTGIETEPYRHLSGTQISNLHFLLSKSHPKIMATQPKHLTESRPDVRGRIDDEQVEEPATAAPGSPTGSSGSSISEEDEVHVPENHVPPAEDLERLALEEHGEGLTDDEDEEGSDSAEYDCEEEEEEWDPEDEDWDLLQGGMS